MCVGPAALYQFKQQKLTACNAWSFHISHLLQVITVFLLMGFVFLPVTLRCFSSCKSLHTRKYHLLCVFDLVSSLYNDPSMAGYWNCRPVWDWVCYWKNQQTVLHYRFILSQRIVLYVKVMPFSFPIKKISSFLHIGGIFLTFSIYYICMHWLVGTKVYESSRCLSTTIGGKQQDPLCYSINWWWESPSFCKLIILFSGM